MTADEFAHKLWITESGGKLYSWGDDGLAMGAYQQHPAWMWDWAHRLALTPLVDESWNRFEGRLVRAFYVHHQSYLTPVQTAMKFHLGHLVYETDSDWDAEYAARFNAAPSTPNAPGV